MISVQTILLGCRRKIELTSFLSNNIGTNSSLRWKSYPKQCVTSNNVDTDETKHSDGDDGVNVCRSECESNEKCSAIEWFQNKWNGVRCYLILDDNRATKGSSNPRWKDATCYIKPGN